MKNGDGMFRKIIIVFLIIALNFTTFADEIDDNSGVDLFKKKEEAPVEKKYTEPGFDCLGGETLLIRVLGFSSIAVGHIISYMMYRNDENNADFELYFIAPVFIAFLAGTGIIAIKSLFDVNRYNKPQSEVLKEGIMLAMNYYTGCLGALLIEGGLLVVIVFLFILFLISFGVFR